jgi:hypothetical protein
MDLKERRTAIMLALLAGGFDEGFTESEWSNKAEAMKNSIKLYEIIPDVLEIEDQDHEG